MPERTKLEIHKVTLAFFNELKAREGKNRGGELLTGDEFLNFLLQLYLQIEEKNRQFISGRRRKSSTGLDTVRKKTVT